MILRTNLPSCILTGRLAAQILALVLLFANATSLLGQRAYITTNSLDGVALLPPPPVRGSVEEVADLASVRAVFNGRTEAEKARAMKDSGLAYSLFQPAVGATFDLDKLPKTKALLEKVKKHVAPATFTLELMRGKTMTLEQAITYATEEFSVGEDLD